MNSSANYKNYYPNQETLNKLGRHYAEFMKQSANTAEYLRNVPTAQWGIIALLLIIIIASIIIIMRRRSDRRKLEMQQTEPVFQCNIFGKCGYDLSNGALDTTKGPYIATINGKSYGGKATSYPPLSSFKTNTYSASAWVYISSIMSKVVPSNTYRHIISISSKSSVNNNIVMPNQIDGVGLFINPINQLEVYIRIGKQTERVIVQEDYQYDKWINLTVVVNMNVVSLYINSRLKKEGLLNGQAASLNSAKIYIAEGKFKSQSNTIFGFGGQIVFVQAYSRALSPREVDNSYSVYKKYINDYKSGEYDDIHYYNRLQSLLPNINCPNLSSQTTSETTPKATLSSEIKNLFIKSGETYKNIEPSISAQINNASKLAMRKFF